MTRLVIRLSPDIAIDKNGAIHVAWQDQRGVDQATRDAAASNADVFEADLGADGKWTGAIQVSAGAARRHHQRQPAANRG